MSDPDLLPRRRGLNRLNPFYDAVGFAVFLLFAVPGVAAMVAAMALLDYVL